MKIAIFVSQFPQFSQTFVIHHIAFLAIQGHQVDVYANYTEKQMTNKEIKDFNLLGKVKYYPYKPRNPFLRFLKGVILVAKNFFKDPNLILAALNFIKHGKKAYSLELLFSIIPFLRVHPQYDIIHCHFGPNGWRAAWLKSVNAIQGKLVVTFHGYDASRTIKNEGDNTYNLLWKTGDLFLPVSDYIRQILLDLGCPSEKTKVHHMGVDIYEFSPQPNNQNDRDAVQVISICRLVEKKGIQFAVEALALYKRVYPEDAICYQIVGDGPLIADLKAKVQEYQLESTINFLGVRTHSQVFQLLQASDILLAPSITAADGDQEGIPVVIMEAMTMGIPVIASCHSGIPELVEDQKTGFLVPEKDVDALYRQLNILIHDENLRYTMGVNGRQKIVEDFNQSKLNSRLAELYQNLVAGTLFQ